MKTQSDPHGYLECSACGCERDSTGWCPNYCMDDPSMGLREEKPFPPKMRILFEPLARRKETP